LTQVEIDSRRAILIVEDEAFIRYDLTDFFEDAGFQVFEADSADGAIALMRANPTIGIVLTDIQMPGSMDGIKLAHYLRERFPPALLFLASGAIKPTSAELPPGAIFVPKPFDPRFVLEVIERGCG
jgi:DNA-binding NtrC family response regulator